MNWLYQAEKVNHAMSNAEEWGFDRVRTEVVTALRTVLPFTEAYDDPSGADLVLELEETETVAAFDAVMACIYNYADREGVWLGLG